MQLSQLRCRRHSECPEDRCSASQDSCRRSSQRFRSLEEILLRRLSTTTRRLDGEANPPVKIDRSKFASEDTSMKRISAGSLFPDLMKTISPGTMSSALAVHWWSFRMRRQLSGSIVVMDAMTRDEDQSCQALNAAWITNTASRTMARARLACAGGFPRGFHDTNTRIEPTRRIDPKPLKRYPKICHSHRVGNGERTFLPYFCSRRCTSSLESPPSGDVRRRFWSSSMERVCHSILDNSTHVSCLFHRIMM